MNNALLSQLQQWQQQAATWHIRLPVVWQGEQQSLLHYCYSLLQPVAAKRVYWIGSSAPAGVIDVSTHSAYQLLGTECDTLVINAFAGLPADLVAASAGCVKAGGLWLVLCPPFADWQQQANPAHKKLLPYPLDALEQQSGFIPFWLRALQQQNVIILREQQVLQKLQWPALIEHTAVAPPCVTTDQQQAVAAICHVVSGHRRRPLVLTAHRGRGKSAALGIAAAQLALQGKQIVLTAPSPTAAQTALMHFQQLTAPSLHSQLQFMPFDALLHSTVCADLVLIDEAAAIPTPVLQQLLKRFSRMVFATTEHGYEGTGRGFQLRFQQHLTAQCPNWRKLQMQQPIRHQQDDPLEQLIFASFLLNQALPEAHYDTGQCLQFDQLYSHQWLAKPDLLKQVFCLLSLAHYQTQVKDLAALLDNPQLSVVTVQQQGRVLGCALISHEGSIPPTLAQQIYHGERRLQGHLLAQSLAFHLAQPPLATQPLWRIMRIAVHPNMQRLGIGKQLLQQVSMLAQQGNIAYLGTSYGVTAELLQFWQQNGYQAVRLGISSDNASAEYSVLMLRSVTADASLVASLQRQFSRNLFYNLHYYPKLNSDLALCLASPPAMTALNLSECEQLYLFSQGKRPFELISHLLLRWFTFNQHLISHEQRVLLCALLWQQHDWPQLIKQFGADNKKALIAGIASIIQQDPTLAASIATG